MSLFVEEEDEMHVDNVAVSNSHTESPDHAMNTENDYEEDDPVVESIPLVLNHLPNTAVQSLHILQYPGRPKTLPYPAQVIKPLIKEESQFLELRVPLDTLKFFDQGRLEEWGLADQIEEHNLQGVLNKTEGGSYVAYIQGEGPEKKLILLPVDRTTQLRTSFKYLDDLELAKQAQRRSDFNDTQKQPPATIQVLQTSSTKSAATQGNTGEGFHNNAMGESLRCIKKFEEEEWGKLEFNDVEDKQRVIQGIHENTDYTELKTDTTMMEYIDKLTSI